MGISKSWHIKNFLDSILKAVLSETSQKIFALIILAILLLFPFSMDSLNLLQKNAKADLLFPMTALFSPQLKGEISFFYISCLSLFILPISFILIAVSFFVKKIGNKIIYILLLSSSIVYIVAVVVGMISFANTGRWFRNLNPLVYIAFVIGLTLHLFLIVRAIIQEQKKDQLYVEYNSILKQQDEENISANNVLIERIKARQKKIKKGSSEYIRLEELRKKYSTSLLRQKRRSHIKTKITIVFFIAIINILAVFVYINLKNYKALLSQNVNNLGINLAEQASAIYRFSDGLHAKIRAFLEGIHISNQSAPFPFERVDIIITDSSDPLYLENIRSEKSLPDFTVFAYTTAGSRLKNIPKAEKQITAKEAFAYIQQYSNQKTKNTPHYNSKSDTSVYVCPITFQRSSGKRLIGFSLVSYLTEVLERPYFQVKVFILSLAVFFVYFSVILTLFLGDLISKPIIFLAGSIRKTANTFSDMLSANAEIDVERFVFKEEIKSNDELKTLSVEIKNMVSLIRGILPYISFHTLRNAEKNQGHKSYLRDLCFLFTDIRGFTSLCENMEAKEITSMLNYYLDLETKIIFDNGGDVDKYVGDELMAFFSGPRKEINACNAAIEIRKAMRQAQVKSIQAKKTTVSIGIGINSGKVVFGPVGSRTRKDYTSIGDAVNLAARLEGANKEYGSKTIISEAVYKELSDDFICRELDFIAVKGKSEAVRIFEILQKDHNGVSESILELKKLFEAGLSYYRRQMWDSANKYFFFCKEKFNDAPSKVFLQRIEHYKINPPPPDWKGVFVMHVK